MSGEAIQALVQSHLQALIGLQLTIMRDAANMKGIHFGPVRPHPSGRGTGGTYALHIQCAWRILSENGLVTGSGDRFADPEEGRRFNEEDTRSGSLQRVRIYDLLKGYDEITRSHVNATGHLFCIGLTVDAVGGVDLALSDAYRLQVFPDGMHGEDWRFFEPGHDGPHLVFESGLASI